MIKGVTVQLVEKTQTGTDWAGNPIYSTVNTDIANVLIGEPSSDDVTNTLSLYGKKIAYTLAIPKGDTHNWTDTEVILPFDGKYRTIGYPTQGIEENIPLAWNKKVKVERYG